MYRRFLKRPLDFILSLIAIVILSPLLIVLSIIGAIAMKGSPFFKQPRPGKDEKIFNLIKFRTMSNAKDKTGKLLSDAERLNSYGKFLRATSLDELPELFNILVGNMSIIGPRPLMVRYLPYYTEEEHRRHTVRPGLTGYAQVHGRNALSWDDRFKLDLQYVDHITFLMDLKIIFDTIKIVFKREGINMEDLGNLDDYRKKSE
ncbi:MAG: sugar transferase [Blautia sp.]|uniref:sugar transferase n=1 Tax=Blautia sp. TaxID=1955243 RepID=UPI0039918D70